MFDAPLGSNVPADQGDWRPGFLVQLLLVVISVTAIHATRPMITYRALDLGAGPFEIGIVQSSFSMLPVMTAVVLGRWVDRLGERRFLIVAMAMIGLGALAATFAGSLLLLAASNAIMGFGQITSLVAGQAMMANRGPRERREHRFGWFSTAASVGQLVGPAVGAILVGSALGAAASGPGGPFAGHPQAPVFLFAGIACGFACLLALRLPGRSARAESAQIEAPKVGMVAAAWQVLHRPGMTAAMVVSITVISAVDVLVAYLPAYGDATGLSVATVGLLLSVRAASSLVSRVLMSQLIDLLGRRRLLALSMVLAGAGIALLPILPALPNVVLLFVVMIAIGLGLGLGQPMTIAWVANRSLRHERGLALGVRLTGNRGALLVVPAALGALAGASGLAAIWLAVAVFLGAGAIVAARTPFDELVQRPGTRAVVVPEE